MTQDEFESEIFAAMLREATAVAPAAEPHHEAEAIIANIREAARSAGRQLTSRRS